ncbi:hypothetical protein TcG_06934 [Trypanosoma cruzi]|nr:hypothetical protein TcG_06934 [Trypanosoma cruzi]
MAHTDRTNPSLGGTVWSVIELRPQERCTAWRPICGPPHRGVTAIHITKHLGFPQCRIAFRPCNAYIIDPYVDTHHWRCGPEAVNHRRQPRNCRSNNNLEIFLGRLCVPLGALSAPPARRPPRGVKRDAESPAVKKLEKRMPLHPGRKRPQPSQAANNGKYVKEEHSPQKDRLCSCRTATQSIVVVNRWFSPPQPKRYYPSACYCGRSVLDYSCF